MGQVQQVKSQQLLADVVIVSPSKFRINFYPASQIGPKNGGQYPTNGATAAVTWTIETPNAAQSDYNTVLVTEERPGAAAKTTTYTYAPADKAWTMVSPGNLIKLRQWSATDPLDGLPVKYYEARDPNTDALLFHEEHKHKRDTASLAPLSLRQTSRGTGANASVANYTQYSNGRILLSTNASGSWSHFHYDGGSRQARIDEVVLGFLDSTYDDYLSDPNGPFRKTTYSYDSVDPANDDGSARPNLARVETQYLMGEFVSQTERVVHKNSSGNVDWIKEYRLVAQDDDLSNPSNFADTRNLVTTTTYITSGTFAGRVETINNPAGTRQVYTYLDSAGQRTTTVLSGSPDSGNPLNVLDGTRSITVQNQNGAVVSHTLQDKASSLTISSETYSNPDEFGRFRRVTYLDGTYEDTYYACCGLDQTIDRDGVTTQYQYDAAGRQVASTRLNIKTTNILNSAHQTLATQRIGSDGSVITLNQTAYNDAGNVSSETNALNGQTTYTTTADADGALTIRTTVYPDGGTRIENYFKDGQLAKVTGTAVQPVRYIYGLDTDAASPDYLHPYSAEIKLTAAGDDTLERTTNYTDVFGRNYETVYAAASPPYPATLSLFNKKGQLAKSVDPDGLVTLYQYKTTGELIYSATDLDPTSPSMNSDGNFPINLSLDWATHTTNDVIYNAVLGYNVRRSQTYTYPTDGSDTRLLVSKQESSTDGLRSWQTVYRDPSTPVVSTSQTLYNNNDGATATGYRTTTMTQPDGSKTVSVYYQGRLLSVARKSATNAPITKITYAYDAHGRQATTTDARNGATVYAYNSGDLITSVTTPAPGNGQGAQTTTTTYDTSLRSWKTTLPDNTSVTNLFDVTGLLTNTAGSRTYPIAYTYDDAGRIKTMKTWQNRAGNSGTAITTWNYDSYRGWLASKRYADNSGPDYEYTDGGHLKKRTWARIGTGSQRIVTNYKYGFNDTPANSQHGDLVEINYANDPQSTPTVTYGYDRRGRQKSIARAGAETATLTYDDANELLSETFTGTGSTLNGLAVTNGYDAFLRRTNLTALNGTTILARATNTYDTASRLSFVSDGTNNATYTYLANSPLVSQIALKSNTVSRVTRTNTYDFLNRLTQISSAPSGAGAVPVSFTYAYNSANQRTRATLADGSFWLYEYDALGQLRSGKRYWPDWTPLAGQQFEYGHDDIGNRTSTKAGGDSSGAGLRPANYAVNNLNQYTARTNVGAVDVMGVALPSANVTVSDGVNNFTPYRKGEYFRKELSVANGSSAVWQTVTVSATGETNVTGNVFVPKTPELFDDPATASVNEGYDADGNQLRDGRWNYTWDAENRLVQMVANTAVGPQQLIRFEYDAKSRRIGKKVWNNTAGTGNPDLEQKFLYDDWNLIAKLNSSAAVLQSFLWGLDLSGTPQGAGGVAGLLAVYDSSTINNQSSTHFAAFDGNGNVAALVSATDGKASANYEYGPFGEPLRVTGPMAKANSFRFSTKYQDDETDLLYYGYRYYTASSGRWLNRDPLEEGGGIATYVAVLNSLLTAVDYLGLVDTPLEKVQSRLVQAYQKTSPSEMVDTTGLPFVLQRMLMYSRKIDVRYESIDRKKNALWHHDKNWMGISRADSGPHLDTVVHEMTHVFQDLVFRWPMNDERKEEGQAYAMQGLLYAAEDLYAMETFAKQNNCNYSRIKNKWQGFWQEFGTIKASVSLGKGWPPVQWGGIFGDNEEPLQPKDIALLHASFKTKFSCRSIATAFNGVLTRLGCCFRVSCSLEDGLGDITADEEIDPIFR